MAARPDPKASEDKETAPQPGRKGRWIAALATVLVLACVAAVWYFTRPAAHEDDEEQQVTQKASEAIFVNLDTFTVNLADEGGERLAQVALVLELDSKEAQAALTKNLPVVRNGILLLLSSQHTKTLLTLDGKLALAAEVAKQTGVALGWRSAAAEGDEAEAEAEVDKPAKARKVAGAKPRKRPTRQSLPNPVVAVHFSQLLVQ
jgi:flagellar FliL protein